MNCYPGSGALDFTDVDSPYSHARVGRSLRLRSLREGYCWGARVKIEGVPRPLEYQ